MGLTAYGAFLVAQQAARRMLPNGKGAILFTGASAGVKGYPQSAAFAMGKFAQTTVSIRMRSPRHTCIC
jgi:NAD(P)-dependent dehydrogenase (short-subunit alcohol dehydrogenase family)